MAVQSEIKVRGIEKNYSKFSPISSLFDCSDKTILGTMVVYVFFVYGNTVNKMGPG